MTPEEFERAVAEVHPAVLEEAVRRDVERRRAAWQERQQRVREAAQRRPKDARRAITKDGSYRHQTKPRVSVTDRDFVPGALEHWRRVHGLGQREAQVRVGYSPDGTAWRDWEQGYTAPSYRVLLRILAATGLGYWVDRDHRAAMDAADRLQADRARHDALAAAAIAKRREHLIASGVIDDED